MVTKKMFVVGLVIMGACRKFYYQLPLSPFTRHIFHFHTISVVVHIVHYTQ